MLNSIPAGLYETVITSIIFTEVTLKLYCVDVVDVTYNIHN